MRSERPLLVGWNRSAYARRVAISMHVYGIEFDQRAGPEDVSATPPRTGPHPAAEPAKAAEPAT